MTRANADAADRTHVFRVVLQDEPAIVREVEVISSRTLVDLANYGSVQRSADLITVLVPDYIQEVPYLDGWKRPYDFYLKTATPTAPQVMAIRSPGRDGVTEGTQYSVTNFEPTDYDRDVIWADGFFVRWPQKVSP